MGVWYKPIIGRGATPLDDNSGKSLTFTVLVLQRNFSSFGSPIPLFHSVCNIPFSSYFRATISYCSWEYIKNNDARYKPNTVTPILQNDIVSSLAGHYQCTVVPPLYDSSSEYSKWSFVTGYKRRKDVGGCIWFTQGGHASLCYHDNVCICVCVCVCRRL